MTYREGMNVQESFLFFKGLCNTSEFANLFVQAEELSSRIHKVVDHSVTSDKGWMSSRFRGA